MNLTLAAIRRPVWVLMAMLAMLVLGFLGLRSMPREQNPEVDFPFVTVTTAYPGAGPEEIETLVTKPIEDAVTSVEGVKQIQSTSLEGVSVVSIEFELGIDSDVALQDVTSKVNAIVGSLPVDAERPVASKLNVAAQPILTIAVESDSLSSLQLRDLVDDRIRARLARIEGVADIAVRGGEVREIRVAVDRDRLISYGLGIRDALSAIAGSTLDVPSGRIERGATEVGVRMSGEFNSVDELRNLVIPITDRQRPNTPPAIVRLKDIATITDGPAERTEISRINGRDAVVMTIQKTREGNTVAITDNVLKALDELEQVYPVKFTATSKSADRVNESLEDLYIALVFGIGLVVLIIYIFLHNFRGTLIVALAIPTSLFAAFAAIAALGFTLNTMTMLGLSLAIGILVDDAIVVLENTYRHLTMGEAPADAAFNGRMEIGLAAVSITLVDVVVFIPIALMGGIVGQFMRPFALTVVAATLFSLFVSFTLTPMLASRWYRENEYREPERGFAGWFERRLHAFADGYKVALDWGLRHRWWVIWMGVGALIGVVLAIAGSFMSSYLEAISPARVFLILGVVIAVGVSLFGSSRARRLRANLVGAAVFAVAMAGAGAIGHFFAGLKGAPLFQFTFFPNVESGLIQVDVTLAPGSSLDRTLQVVKRVEEAAMGIPEVNYVTSIVGRQSASGFGVGNTGSQYASLTVSLKPKRALLDTIEFWKKHDESLRTRKQTTIQTELMQRIGKVPGAEIVVHGQGNFGPGGDIQVAVRSLDPANALPAAEKVAEILRGLEGVVNVGLSSKPGKPELSVIPDRTKLADNDLSVAQMGAVLRALYEGNTDAKYREGGREYDIRVNLSDATRKQISELENVPVTFRDGRPVLLSEVARIERTIKQDKVERLDRQRQVTAYGYLLPGYVAGSTGARLREVLRNTDLGEGVTWQELGQNQAQQNEQGHMAVAFLLALIFVFMVLAALFDNILYPLIIQLAQPQAMVGALLALMITGKPFDIVGFIAVIMLIGLVGKNAILLVDFANTLRSRGLNRHEALLESGRTRMRPILMTTLALILAMIPLAVSLGRGSEFRSPLGVIIIGGMSLSTLLTLFVIPCSYTIFDDLSRFIGGAMRALTGRMLKQPNDGGAPPERDGHGGTARQPGEVPERVE